MFYKTGYVVQTWVCFRRLETHYIEAFA